jgi:type II secretory pathway component GspD/PulD (secretin)
MNRNIVVKRIVLSMMFLFCCVSLSYATPGEDQKKLKNPEDYISVEFNQAPLTEIIMLVSEYSGQAFVVSSQEEIFLSWIEQNILKDDLLNRFKKVVIGAGLTLNSVHGRRELFVIKKDAVAVANSAESLGFYPLQNLDPEALKDTSEILYAGSLAINSLEGSNVVIFSGSPDLVAQFVGLLQKIDKPRKNDFEVIRLKNISVKTGIKALSDTKLIENNTFYPDYWNRSILVKGSNYERNVALAVLTAIDKPQVGWIDQLEFVHTVDTTAATALLSSACENVTIRTVASDRILLSGNEKDVEKASVLLHRIDGTGLQVKVEAIIAYLTDREFKELGIKLKFQDSHNSHALNGNLIDTLVSKNTGLLLNYFNDFLGITVAAEEGRAHGEILSSPVLTVMNGQEARIHVGQNVPFLSKANFNKNDGKETGTSIQRKDIGITFRIKPSIEPNGEFVYLTVNQEVSNITDDSELSQNAVDIIVDKKEISSTVLVADGDTIFLGGLRSEENGTAKDFIPFLGELPIIGKLFTYDVAQKQNRHLIVSLRVNVVGRQET